MVQPLRWNHVTTPDFLSHLSGVKANSFGWTARCPAHDDTHNSLSISEGVDGRILIHCHAGCTPQAAVAVLGLKMSDLMPARQSLGKIIATYDYVDEDGKLLYQVCRFEPKNFRPRRSDGNGGWIWNLVKTPRALYRLPKIIEAARSHCYVWIVEGEKDVDNLAKLGIIATTNSGGAEKWSDDYSRHLVGCAGVVVVADADSPGQKHAQAVARSLHKAGVRRIKVIEMPNAKDVSAYIEGGHSKDELVAIAKGASLWVAPKEKDSECPTLRPIIRPLIEVESEVVRPIWPGRVFAGKINQIDGDGGLGKTASLIDLAARLTRGDALPGGNGALKPMPVIFWSAEDGAGDTLKPRAETAGADLRIFHVLEGACDADDKPRAIDLSYISVIRDAIVQTGAGFFVADPMSAFLPSRVDSWKDADVRTVLRPIAEIAQQTGVGFTFVRHLMKGRARSAQHAGLGSVAFSAAARSVLLVATDPEDEERRILASAKCNLAAKPPSLAYRLTTTPSGILRVEWLGSTNVSAEDLIRRDEDTEAKTATDEAVDFLGRLLESGPVAVEDVMRQSKAAGLSWPTVKKAKGRSEIKSIKHGGQFGGDQRWYWESLAEGIPETLKGGTVTLTENAHEKRNRCFE